VFKTVKKHGDDQAEQRLTVLDAGSVFGEMSFFQPAPHSASIRTLSAVEVHRLSRKDFESLETDHAPAARKILVNTVKLLAERLRSMDEWICELVERPDGATTHQKEWRDFRAKLYTDWHF